MATTSDSRPWYVGETTSTAATRPPPALSARSTSSACSPRQRPLCASYSGASHSGSAPELTSAWIADLCTLRGEHGGDDACRAAVDEEPRAARAEGRRRQLLRPSDRALGCEEVVQLRELGQVVAQPAPAQQPSQPPRRTRAHLVAREEEGRSHGIRRRLQCVDERRFRLV
eukprot:scaffold26257_cov63-Phaeocystis_antarctica.AAC.2